MSDLGTPIGFCERCSSPVHQEDPGASIGPPLLCARCAGTPAYLGVFEIHRLLGRGAMGEVYKAIDTRFGTVVALKLIKPDRVGDRQVAGRFLQETQVVGALNHPGIVGLVDQGEADGVPFLALEYVEGKDLGVIQRERPGRKIPVGEALDWTRQILAALDHAHRRGVIHRDLKPTNILLTPESQLKILDFGLGRLLDADGSRLTADRQSLGSPHFIAPEQLLDASATDHRADLHAVAALFFRFITGKFVYPKKKTLVEYIQHVITAPPRRLSDVMPGAPSVMCEFFDRGLAKQPQDRFQHAREMLAFLEPL